MESYKDQEFLEYVVKTLVDHPEDVTIERQVDEMGVLLRLRVHPEDMGQIVGRQGATAKAIRSLLRIVGIKANARVNLKIEEPEGSTRVPNSTNSTDSLRQTQGESGQDKSENSTENSVDSSAKPEASDDVDVIADELRL